MNRNLIDLLFSEDFDSGAFFSAKPKKQVKEQNEFKRIDKKRIKKRDFTQERKAKRNELEFD